MNDIQQLRFWTYKILPLVYDDSLSYYEVLAKVSKKLNEVITNVNEIPDAIKETVDSDELAQGIMNSFAKAIATNEGEATYTATAKEGGELIWLNNVLYEVTAPMAVGTNYVVGSNISPLVISDELNHMKDYLSDMNEFYHERSAKAYDTGVYLYYKNNLYITTKDIAVNDILYTDGNSQNLKEVTLGNEVRKHYTEMHEADLNLQNQIDGNDGDIENLQKEDVNLQNQITTNNRTINSRVDKIVAQSSTDNTEVVDARTWASKLEKLGTSSSSLGTAIRSQINLAITAGGKYLNNELSVLSPNKNLAYDQKKNTAILLFSDNAKEDLGLPASTFYGISITICPTGQNDNQNKIILIPQSPNEPIFEAYIPTSATTKPTWYQLGQPYTIKRVTPVASFNTILTNSNLATYLPNKTIRDLTLNTIYSAYLSTAISDYNLPYSSGTFTMALLSYQTHSVDKYILGIASNGYTFAYCYSTPSYTSWKYFNPSDITKIQESLSALQDQISSLTSKEKLSAIPYHNAFTVVGCIGDSYTAGFMTNRSTGETSNSTPYSWPNYLAKSTGNTYRNYGISGATIKSWLTSDGYTKAKDEKCQCYLIGLGLNTIDIALGTIDDCEDDSKDTFYRNYYILLETVHNINPTAILYPLTAPTIGDRAYMSTYNPAIKAIAEKYKDTLNTYVVDLAAYSSTIYNNAILTAEHYSWHYGALGYQILSTFLADIWDLTIEQNYEALNNLGFIPTDISN